jgi:hypothetical protein
MGFTRPEGCGQNDALVRPKESPIGSMFENPYGNLTVCDIENGPSK